MGKCVKYFEFHKIVLCSFIQLFHQAAAEFKHKMNKANEKERAMYKAMFNPDSKSTVDKKNKASSGVRHLC